MIIIHPETIAVRKQPSNLKSKDLKVFSHEFRRRINAAHIRIERNVHLFGGVMLKLHTLNFFKSYIYPPSTGFHIKSQLHHTIHLAIALLKGSGLLIRKGENIPHAVWITDRRSHEYFHWMTDALPRLITARNVITSHTLLLPLRYKKYPYIVDSLSYFKIPVRFFSASEKIKIKEFVLPSHTALPGNYNKQIINELRSIFLSKFSGILPSRKLYISRQKAKKRKVNNEQSVIRIFEKYGYECHCMEDYSLSKQIELCVQSKAIAGLHGAGLTSMLFMQEKGQLLELRNEDDCHNNCYFSLASDLNIDYYYQINKGNKKDTHDVTITVDLTELEKNLQLMLEKQAC